MKELSLLKFVINVVNLKLCTSFCTQLPTIYGFAVHLSLPANSKTHTKAVQVNHLKNSQNQCRNPV